jgi:hemoglobin
MRIASTSFSRFSRRARVLTIAALALAGTTLLPIATVSAQTANGKPSLYQRLGGYDEIAAYIGLVFPRVAQHPELTHMFRGHGKDSQQRQFQFVVELICQKTGGPCAYVGRAMPPVHEGIGITDAHWTTFMQIIETGMRERKYAPDVRAEFIEIWRGFRSGVVVK